jgi:hypothetical protein
MTTTTPIYMELMFARQRFANNCNTEFETDPKNNSVAHTTLRTDGQTTEGQTWSPQKFHIKWKSLRSSLLTEASRIGCACFVWVCKLVSHTDGRTMTVCENNIWVKREDLTRGWRQLYSG